MELWAYDDIHRSTCDVHTVHSEGELRSLLLGLQAAAVRWRVTVRAGGHCRGGFDWASFLDAIRSRTQGPSEAERWEAVSSNVWFSDGGLKAVLLRSKYTTGTRLAPLLLHQPDHNAVQQTFVLPADGAEAFMRATVETLHQANLPPTLIDLLYVPSDDFLLSATREASSSTSSSIGSCWGVRKDLGFAAPRCRDAAPQAHVPQRRRSSSSSAA
jgi:hypothetical protein